jgi:hypothetical protein
MVSRRFASTAKELRFHRLCVWSSMFFACCLFLSQGETLARAAEPKPETVAAFDRYIRATEARMDDDARHNRFLIVDRLPPLSRLEAYDQLQRGQIHIEEVHASGERGRIRIPSGLVHDWAGVIFIPNVTLPEVIAVLEDFDRHDTIYAPDLRQSQLLERNGDRCRIYLQFFSKSAVTVVLNVDFDVRITRFGAVAYESTSRSTRIAELADPGKANEHELPAGKEHGFIWRLYSDWRAEEKDGGVYVQNESIALSRTVPPVFAWFVNPLLQSIPRNLLTHLLNDTGKAVINPGTRATEKSSSAERHLWLYGGLASGTSYATPFPKFAHQGDVNHSKPQEVSRE